MRRDGDRAEPGLDRTGHAQVGGSSREGAAGTGMEQLTPLWLLKYLPNMLACPRHDRAGCEGRATRSPARSQRAVVCVGESTRVIERGAADLCFSGGLEGKLSPMGMLRLDLAGFTARPRPRPTRPGSPAPTTPRARPGVCWARWRRHHPREQGDRPRPRGSTPRSPGLVATLPTGRMSPRRGRRGHVQRGAECARRRGDRRGPYRRDRAAGQQHPAGPRVRRDKAFR